MQYSDKELEVILSNYKYLLNQIRLATEEAYNPYRETDTNTGGSSSGRISNPTEDTAIAVMLVDTQEIEKQAKAIQNTYAKVPQHQKRMMEVYYFERSYGMTLEATSQRLNIDVSTLRRWRKDVRQILRKELNK